VSGPLREEKSVSTKYRLDGRFDSAGRLRPVMVERLGRAAVAEAIARHKAAGRSVYYTDPAHPGFLVEERSDGRRFLVREDPSGELEVAGELPPE
jgi:hypothetical protein